MSGETERSPLVRRFATAVIVAGVVTLALVSLTAAAYLGQMIDNRWREFPATSGVRGLALTLVPVAVLAGGIVVLRRASEAALDRWTPLAPLATLVLVRLVAIAIVPTPVPADNDPGYLHELAVGVLDGGNPMVAHRPMGYSALLAALYAVFGPHPLLAELLNLAAAIVVGWLLFLLAGAAWGRRAGATAVFVYAVLPSQVLMVTTIFTETLYSAVLLAAIAFAVGAIGTQRTILMVGAGVVLALSQYVRPLSQAFLPVFAAAPLLAGLRWSRAGLLALAVAGSFIVVMLPVVVHNASVNGALSLSTSSYGGWSLFVGANQEHDGRFNSDDQAILRATPGRSVWEQSETLGRAGIERMTDDPQGFADLVVRKIRVLWADDTYGVTNAFPGWATTAARFDALRLASQGIYVMVATLAAIGLWRMRQAPSSTALLIAGIVVVVAIAHLFVEVQPRYHAYLLPLLCALAGATLVGWRPSGLQDS